MVDAVACAVAIQKELADREADAPADQPARAPHRHQSRRRRRRRRRSAGRRRQHRRPAASSFASRAACSISGTAYDHMQGKLGLPLDFVGEEQVKNIERPVRSYSVRLGDTAATARWNNPIPKRLRLPLAAAAIVVAAAAGAGAYFLWPKPVHFVATTKPSIAVLPFDNLGGDERERTAGARG